MIAESTALGELLEACKVPAKLSAHVLDRGYGSTADFALAFLSLAALDPFLNRIPDDVWIELETTEHLEGSQVQEQLFC